ncbi:hypothetical protein XB02_18020 [Pantoea ananatis]|nr:hypothetical protein XB02_18020 [Pantoea ananatis]
MRLKWEGRHVSIPLTAHGIIALQRNGKQRMDQAEVLILKYKRGVEKVSNHYVFMLATEYATAGQRAACGGHRGTPEETLFVLLLAPVAAVAERWLIKTGALYIRMLPCHSILVRLSRAKLKVRRNLIILKFIVLMANLIKLN